MFLDCGRKLEDLCPQKHRENMQPQHGKPSLGLKPGPVCFGSGSNHHTLKSVALTGWYICQGSDTDLFTETNVFFWAISETFWVNYRLFAGKPLCAALFLIVLKSDRKQLQSVVWQMEAKWGENRKKIKQNEYSRVVSLHRTVCRRHIWRIMQIQQLCMC